MGNPAIIAENISKQYRLGQVGTGTLRHDLNRFWYKVRGKENPYLKIGDSNDRSKKGSSDYVWSLKDINFEIEQGDAVGIIGRNGAGKSTLLKLLSKVTKPTTGSFKVNGRIASLLEVGTGFNPEMTGRENIYLNGAILGMRRQEITRKFDEIVDFSGVERYIDTPVKRYSSGMYVRLAFAVAAHLESEILIIDEVLSVGDAEFQKKCLGKMGDVSKGEGRTVLFVSHNMGAIQKLCDNAILLSNGKLAESGKTVDVINKYLSFNNKNSSNEFHFVGNNDISYATKLEITDLYNSPLNEIPVGKPWKVTVHFTVKTEVENLIVGLGLLDIYDNPIRTSWNKPTKLSLGEYKAVFIEDQIIFATGEYKLVVGISLGKHSIQYIDQNIYFTISDIVEKQEETVISNSNGMIINQMKMYVEKDVLR